MTRKKNGSTGAKAAAACPPDGPELIERCPVCGRYPLPRWDARRGVWAAVCRGPLGLRHIRAAGERPSDVLAAWNAEARKRRGGPAADAAGEGGRGA